jgi:hypothetical protein
LADTYNIDLFALTETWISPNTTSAELFDATPPGFLSLAILGLFLLPRSLLQLVAAQHSLFVNLTSFSPFLQFQLF